VVEDFYPGMMMTWIHCFMLFVSNLSVMNDDLGEPPGILQVAQGGVLTGIIQGKRMHFIVDLLLLQDEVETSLTGLLGPDLSRTRMVMDQSVGACYVVEQDLSSLEDTHFHLLKIHILVD